MGHDTEVWKGFGSGKSITDTEKFIKPDGEFWPLKGETREGREDLLIPAEGQSYSGIKAGAGDSLEGKNSQAKGRARDSQQLP